jgi:hypothetical protein
MSEVEIQYIVPDAAHSQQDVEQILAAIGAYQHEVPFPVAQTAEIEQKKEDSVMLRLIRTSLTPMYDHDLLELAEKMRRGVESHFSEADRIRLSKFFSGVDARDPIEVEKP